MTDRLNLPSIEDIKKIIKLDQTNLPSFPQVAAKLMEASRDDKASLHDLAKIVETDPGISIKVLEIVNSAMYGLGRKITSLADAVVILGLDEIKKLAIGMTVFEKMFKVGTNEQFNRLLFWRHCLSVAVLSMKIAEKTGYHDPDEAYIAGLLHDIGKVFLDTRGKNDYGKFITLLSASTDIVIEKERSVIGIGHDDVGAFFCSRWQLPEKLVLAVKYHHQPFEHLNLTQDETLLVSIVSLANFLCWTQGIGSFDFIRPPILPPEVEKTIDLEKIDVIGCIHHMNKEIEGISKFYHFAFPTTTQLRENLLWANLKLSKANTKYYYQEDPLKSIQSDTISMDGDLALNKEDLDFAKPLAKARNVKEVLDIVMYQVGKIFQPLHWSILLKEPKTGDMVFSVVVGTNKEKLLGVKLPKGEGVVGHIMETGESLIIEDVTNDSRFSLRVDKHSGFKTRSIIGTPLKTEEKTFGVIELINKINDENFTRKELKILSSIAEYAAIAIERSYYNQALTKLATKDSLTSLKNKWSFERAISNKDDVLKNYGTIFSLLIIDMQGFDKFLESHGQEPANTLLKALALNLTKAKRRNDEIFRYGEDTFVMILPQTYAEGAKEVKNRIMEVFSKKIAKKISTPIQLNIFAHTVSARDSGLLKTLVRESLSHSKALLNDDTLDDIEDSLQPMVAKENKNQSNEAKKTKSHGQAVSLSGEFIHLKTRDSGYIRVETISMAAMGLRISKSNRIGINDFLDIQFTLDDLGKSIIKRRIIVREISGNYINADFYNPPPYSKNLGFYLMN
jgi:two-component system cell cycle response regulator